MSAKRAKKKTTSKKAARGKSAARSKSAAKSAGKAAKKAPKKAAKKAVGKKRAKAPVAKKPRPERPAKKRAVKAAPPRKPKRRRIGAADLRRFRRALLDKRDGLLQAYLNAKGDSRNRTLDGTEDYIDYAVSSYDREFLLSLTEMDQKHLMLVEEALRRIERRRDYGQCAQCQQEIPLKRLEVQPWARYCLRCQELDEQGLLVTDDREGDFGDEDDEEGLEVEADETEDLEDEEADEESDDDSLDGDRILSS